MPTPAIQAIIQGAPIRVSISGGPGPGGKSAYQLAVENGFVGTVEEWLESLVGPEGPTGDAATITVGTTTTLAAGSPATVTNSGTSSAAVFDFGIPQGAAGPNSVTSATASDGTADLIVRSININNDSGASLEVTATDDTAITASASGIGIAVSASAQETCAELVSLNQSAVVARSGLGTWTIESFNDTFRQSAIERVRGWFVWFYDTFTGRLKTDDITANRDWTLPDASGNIRVAPIVVSAAYTARPGQDHIVVATATIADPTPTEGAWYRVIVRNGTATVGGTAYATAGTIIERSYHSGSWANRVYNESPVLGTGVSTALAVNTGSAGAFVVNGGALGTPSSGNLANCTFPTLNQNTTGNAATATALQTARTINGVSFNGTANITVTVPISTGVTGLGTGIATFLATPTSANLATAVTDETGSGSLVFGTSPTIDGATLTTLERNTMARIHAMAMTQSPPAALFEDFNGALGAGVYSWTNSGTGSDTQGNGERAFGVRRMTTGSTSGNQRKTILQIPTTSIFGLEIRAHFAIPNVTTCDAFIGMEQTAGAFGRYFLLYAAALNSGRWVLVTGTGAGVFTNFGTNGPSNGDFLSGKRYRCIMRPVNATTVYVKIDEADWNADNWSVMHDANVTITSYTPSTDPMALDIRVNTQTSATRSLDIDYISAQQTTLVR